MQEPLLIEKYKAELQKGYLPEARAFLIKGLNTFRAVEEWLLELMDLISDHETLKTFTQDDMNQIAAIKEQHNGKNYSDITLFEAAWLGTWQNSETIWLTLFEALLKTPEHDGLLTAIEELNSCPEDAPVFADQMEILAKKVYEGKFPKTTFEYLLLVLVDPDDPEQFDLAIKISNGK